MHLLVNRAALVATLLAATFAIGLGAQGGGQQAPPFDAAQGAPSASRGAQTPRAAAPIDLAGVWVSAITEDWRFRMVTPPKGDFASLPLNAEGQRVGNLWDPDKDIAAGEQCKAYGAPGLMRLPTRLRISWENDTTLTIESDAGTQVRRFIFRGPGGPNALTTAPPPAVEPSWQGSSVAQWETQPEGQGVAPGGGGGGRGGAPPLSGALKVVTTSLRPGYLRRNGAPYSGQAVYTEFFDRVAGPNKDSWLIVTSIVDDPTYLSQPYMNSTQFKLEPDGSKFSPRPCEVTPPVEGEASRRGRGGN